MMLLRRKLLCWMVIHFLCVSMAHACTIWGAIKPDEVLIAKNRDFYPGNQVFRRVAEKNKYTFFGLYGDREYDNHYLLKMGINEKGLVVFMTFASTIPVKQRQAKIDYAQVMETILKNYANVDAIHQHRDQLFPDSTPINYVFSDRKKTLFCGVGLNNHYQCQQYARKAGKTITFAQTNHYIISGLASYNLTPVLEQQTSYQRLDKIKSLMKVNAAHLDFEHWINFSLNTEATNDDPAAFFDAGYDNTYQDNSIFRTFNRHPDRKDASHINSDQNVSSMIIQLPNNEKSPVTLYLRIIDKIIDRNDKNDTQAVHYTMAVTTLDDVINHPQNIIYQKSVCQRNRQAIQCV